MPLSRKMADHLLSKKGEHLLSKGRTFALLASEQPECNDIGHIGGSLVRKYCRSLTAAVVVSAVHARGPSSHLPQLLTAHPRPPASTCINSTHIRQGTGRRSFLLQAG